MKKFNKAILIFILTVLTGNVIHCQTVLTLDDAINIALENSPNMKRSKLNLERSQESLNAQDAALKSRFDLQITPFDYYQSRKFTDIFSTWYSTETKSSLATLRITQPVIWTDGTLALENTFLWRESYSEEADNSSANFINDLRLSYTQPLFTYNRTKLRVSELELDLENSALSYAIQKLQITRTVSENFYAVFEQRMRVQIAKDDYESQKNNYTLTQNKVEADILSRDELYQAELNMLNSQMNLQNQQVTLQNQLDQFKQSIGMDISEEIDLITDVSYNYVEVDLNKAIEHGVNNRMELRQREIDIENAQFNLIETSATNEFFGNITLAGGLIGTNENIEDVYSNPTDNQQFTLTFDIPLFDWGQRESLIRASETSIEVADINRKDEEIGIMVNLRSVYRNLQNLETQIEISEVSERNAQLSYEINLERYSNGDLSSFDLQQFQSQLSNAKLNRVNALISYKLELLNLKIQSLWDFENNKAVLPDIRYGKYYNE
jgi:outer membrane protein TolC